MSTPLPPRVPNATRQLLDELDVLMQRMLELPVNELPSVPEEPAATSGDAHKGASDPSTVADDTVLTSHPPTPSLPVPHLRADSPVPQPLGQQVPILSQSSPAPLPLAWHPALKPPERRESAPAPQAGPHKAVLPSVQRPAANPWQSRPQPQPMAGWLLPSLLWSNRTFDRCTGWLGWPGHLLRRRAGRAFLGWLGVGLLLGAACWGMANWLDWTW